MSKIPLIAFSGGLDSTYLLYTTLQKTPCDVVYFISAQTGSKVLAELAHMRFILDYLNKNESLKKVVNVYIKVHRLGLYHTSKGGQKILNQPLDWVYLGVEVFDCDQHGSFQIAYGNDDIRKDTWGDYTPQFFLEMKRAFEALLRISKYKMLDRAFFEDFPDGAPRLEFPIMGVTKETMYSELPPVLKHSYWKCESPLLFTESEKLDLPFLDFFKSYEDLVIKHISPCGRCATCRGEIAHLIQNAEHLEKPPEGINIVYPTFKKFNAMIARRDFVTIGLDTLFSDSDEVPEII